VHHLSGICGEDDCDAAAEIDRVLLETVRSKYWRGNYDLIAGLVGIGVYFLERLPVPAASQGVAAVVERLAEYGETTPSGITWHTRPEFLSKKQREACPAGYYNLGVAHGVPGVIHFLSEAVAASIHAELAESVLDGAVKWVLGQRVSQARGSIFPNWTPRPAAASPPHRLAWCYGDLGICATLLQAARRLHREEWRAQALDILGHCLERDFARSAVQDAGLCHGAAGVAHIYNRIYQSERDVRCLNAAQYWYARVLDMRQEGTGIGGFSAMNRDPDSGAMTPTPSAAFLEGSLGIALALLAACSTVEPCWDRILMLSGCDRTNRYVRRTPNRECYAQSTVA
jgi:hypothetical protein